MAVIKIDLDKPVQEFEVGGETYKAYYDDESLKKYQKQAFKFHGDLKKYENMNVDELMNNEKKYNEMEEKGRQAAKEMIETFFGEGAYDGIYEASGRSTVNMMEVAKALMEWLDSKLKSVKNERKQYYTKR